MRKNFKQMFPRIFIVFFVAYLFVGSYMMFWDLSFGLTGVIYRLAQKDILISLPWLENISNGQTVFIGFAVWSFSVALAFVLCCLEFFGFSTKKSIALLALMIICHLASLLLFPEINQNNFDCWFHAVLALINLALFVAFITHQIKLLLKALKCKEK